MNRKITFLTIILIVGQLITNAQAYDNTFRIMFYNVENLFDTEDDPNTRDEEFTPTGMRAWTDYKLKKKISNIYKVIAAVGEGSTLDMVGFCEIENRAVLEMITDNTPLKHHGYEIIHKDSKDRRGIDVGLIYRKDRYWPIEEKFITTSFRNDPSKVSRDILYSKGILPNKDTLHIFVNHWPSKYGGAMATRTMREDVALTLRAFTDSIFASNPNANIVISGDLNTGPLDEPVKETLGAVVFPDTANSNLINLTTAIYPSKYPGTIKFQGVWECIDIWILSKALLNDPNSLTQCSPEQAFIGEFDFLLEEDKTYLGLIPFRTYIGMSFNDGYSDHLPTYIHLTLYDKP
jgi:hypothetical protein